MTTTTTPVPLTVELVSAQHPGDLRDPGEGLTSVYGYHPTWCINDPRDIGVSVDEHGEWCEAIAGVGCDAHHIDGTPDALFVYVVEPYVHGVIRTEDSPRIHAQYVRLITGGDDQEGWLYLSAPGARSLAASLIHAADKLELR